MKRRMFAACAGAGLLAACRRSGRPRVAVIPKGTTHLFWVAVEAGAREAGRQFGLDILWNGPATETDFNRQIQILDSMIAQHVDGICLAVSERQALVAPVERAVKAGIPVTVFDSGLDSDVYMSFVGTDNVLAGRLAARHLAGLLKQRGSVAIILHAPGSLSTMDREAGFRETIAQEFPAIRIVAEQFAMSDRGKARAATENILAAHPGLDGLYTTTEPSAAGALLALKARSLSGKIHLVTNDSSQNLTEELRAGNIDAMVAQDPYLMAFNAVKTIAQKLRHEPAPKRVDMQPRVVTRADLNLPEVQQMLNPHLARS